MEQVKQLLRGEPLMLRGILVAILAGVGVKITDGQAENWIAVAAPIVLWLIGRLATTPAKNPAPPTTIAVKDDEAETPAALPPVQLPPILTLTGQRR
jgi:hypothetical protein